MKLEGATEDRLRGWLVVQLEPISEADPDVLARYVMALLRNDKPLAQLRSLCAEQLEDFLGDGAIAFVEQLFAHIQSEDLAGECYCSPVGGLAALRSSHGRLMLARDR